MVLSEFQSYTLFFAILIISYVFPGIDDRLKLKLWNGKYFNRLFTCLLFLFLFLLLTYRNCGVDTPTYEYTFVHDRSNSNYDLVFFRLLHLVRKYTNNILVWQGVMSGVTLIGFFGAAEYLKDITDRKLFYLYMIVYLYFFSFNYSRMMMSVGVLMFAFSLLVTEHYKGYVITNIVAGLIHFTSFSVLLIALLFYLGRNHRRVLIVIGLFGAILIRVRPEIIKYLTFSEHYSGYFSDSLNTSGGIGTIIMVLPYFALLFYCDRNLDNRIVTLMYVLLIGNVALGFLGYAVPVASRIARFTLSFPCIFIPAYLANNNSRNLRVTHSSRVLYIVLALLIYFGFIQTTFLNIGIVPFIFR